MRHRFVIFSLLTLLLGSFGARGDVRGGYGLDVLVGGDTRPQYFHNGTTYIEALRGRDYALRITNPTPYRVAVALSVDGLNSINAKHTDAWNAAKWIIEPYGSVVIPGWQINESAARRFKFTGERHSYGAFLGETENLGVIEAVFFMERHPVTTIYEPDWSDAPGEEQSTESGRMQSGAPAPPSSARGGQPKLSDDYAATGMGYRTNHDIDWVDIDLDPTPVAKVRIRYEFRPQLVKLGVIPSGPTPLERRERARGFEGYCPEPD